MCDDTLSILDSIYPAVEALSSAYCLFFRVMSSDHKRGPFTINDASLKHLEHVASVIVADGKVSTSLRQYFTSYFGSKEDPTYHGTYLHYYVLQQRCDVLRNFRTSTGTGNNSCIDYLEKDDTDNNTPLMIAAMYGLMDALSTLIEIGASVDIQNKYGFTPLMLAVLYGHTEAANALIDASTSLEYVNKAGNTPLMLASLSNRAEIAKRLITKNAEVDARNGHNSLICVLTETKSDLATQVRTVLTDNEASLQGITTEGHYVYMFPAPKQSKSTSKDDKADPESVYYSTFAQLRQEVESLKICLALTSEILWRQNKGSSGHTALMLTALYNHGDVAQVLIDKNASLDTKDDYGETALKLAIDRNNSEFVRALRGRSDNAIGQALVTAVRDADRESLRVLVDAKAPLEIMDDDGNTPLLLAAKKNNVSVIKLLHDAGAYPDARDKDGKSIVDKAIADGNVEILTIFNRSITKLGCDGQNMLTRAVIEGDTGKFELFVKADASLDVSDSSGYTALASATMRGDLDFVRRLIAAKASLNMRDRQGNTALALAARNGDTDIMTALLTAKASLYPVNESGYSALMLAVCRGDPCAVSELIKAGALEIRSGEFDKVVSLAHDRGDIDVLKVLMSEPSEELSPSVGGSFSHLGGELKTAMQKLLQAAKKSAVDDSIGRSVRKARFTSNASEVQVGKSAVSHPSNKYVRPLWEDIMKSKVTQW